MAQAEDKDLFEEGMSLSEGTVLMNKKANFGDNGSWRRAEDEYLLS